MELLSLPWSLRGPKRPFDTPVVACCIILLTFIRTAPAEVPSAFSTFLKENSAILSVGHDSAGKLYTFGVLTGGSQFVSRLDANASKTEYSVNVSGVGCEQGKAMAVDSTGNVFITGSTVSGTGQGFPCVLKLDASGKLIYSFVIERAAAATGQAIAIDFDGSTVVTGWASAFGFPSAGGGFSAPASSLSNYVVLQPFIARIDPTGSKLLASAIGVGGDRIAIGPRGDIFVSGNAAGIGVGNGGEAPNSYPVTPGAFQTTFAPSFDCASSLCQLSFPSPEQYVTRLDSALAKLIYSTYVTGSHGAGNSALAVDSAGNAYLTGSTHSTDYPNTAPSASTRPGVFLTKLDPTGSKLFWSLQQGGDLLAFDSTGNLILGGSATPAAGLPNSYPPYPTPPPPPAGDVPAACLPTGLRVQIAGFVQRISAIDGSVLATQLLSATRAQPSALDVIPDGRVLVAGAAIFPDIPITPDTVFSSAIAQRTPSGAFLAGFDLTTSSLGGALACVADGLTNMPIGPVAPGQLISLFGNGLGPAQPLSASISGPAAVPLSLGGVAVTFDGVAAPLTYVSSGQINVGVPWEISGKSSAIMSVIVNGNPIASRRFAVATSSPSLFVDTSGPVSDGNSFFPAIALNSDGTKNSPANPAQGGSLVTILLNGVAAYEGSVPPMTGSITEPNPKPIGISVTVNAGTASLESGLLTPWPGVLSGLYQVQVRMPASTQNGPRAVPLTVTVGGVPAAPLVYFDKVYQGGGLVWMN